MNRTAAHTPVAPSSVSAYYPITAVSSLIPEASTVGTIGTAAPTGTGATSAPYPEFTGAASNFKVGGALAGIGAVAAFLL